MGCCVDAAVGGEPPDLVVVVLMLLLLLPPLLKGSTSRWPRATLAPRGISIRTRRRGGKDRAQDEVPRKCRLSVPLAIRAHDPTPSSHRWPLPSNPFAAVLLAQKPSDIEGTCQDPAHCTSMAIFKVRSPLAQPAPCSAVSQQSLTPDCCQDDHQVATKFSVSSRSMHDSLSWIGQNCISHYSSMSNPYTTYDLENSSFR